MIFPILKQSRDLIKLNFKFLTQRKIFEAFTENLDAFNPIPNKDMFAFKC